MFLTTFNKLFSLTAAAAPNLKVFEVNLSVSLPEQFLKKLEEEVMSKSYFNSKMENVSLEFEVEMYTEVSFFYLFDHF